MRFPESSGAAAPSLHDAWTTRRDQFDRLRLIAGALVIYGHSYALVNPAHGATELLARLTRASYAGEIAVWMFFAISGFLLSMRWLARPDARRFVQNRVLRILPGYAVCLLLSALLLGPLLTDLPLGRYLSDPGTWSYVLGNLSFLAMRYQLPGVYTDLPYAGVVNGSLWSLQIEVYAYTLLLGAGLAGLLRPGRIVIAVLLGVGLTVLIASQLTRLAPEISPALGAFALGALAAVHARHIPLHGALPLAAGLIFALATVLDLDLSIRRGLLLLTVSTLTLWLAYRFPQRAAARDDPSYGLYLYGFPVQQLCLSLTPGLTPMALTALALPLAGLLGWCSWRLVEAPALRWKRADSPARPALRDAPSPTPTESAR
ncbi:MAG: acyltransferase [Xanthomonadales bacterium]|nr:acyltransferase [Xanthomonadales bacterium]